MRYQEFITEGPLWNWIRSMSQRLVKYLSNLFKKLEFGQSKTIQIPNPPQVANELSDVNRESWNLTAVIGYLNEYATAYKLGLAMNKAGVNVEDLASIKTAYEQYRAYVADNAPKFKEGVAKVNSEIQRAEEGSQATADTMYQELVNEVPDLKFMDMIIKHEGIEAMGQGKQDVTITVKKKSKQEVIKMIKASLKLYQDAGSVNLYNVTFPAYISKILAGIENPGTGKKAIQSFLDALPDDKAKEFRKKIDAVTDITGKWKEIKANPEAYKNEPWYDASLSGRQLGNAFITANKGYQKMAKLMFEDMFDYFYAQDKQGINDRMLKALGLDGADDIYLAAGKTGKNKRVVSSRNSESFKKLYEALKNDFDIDFAMEESKASVAMTINDRSGKLASFNIPFKEGQTFTHMLNMGDFLD